MAYSLIAHVGTASSGTTGSIDTTGADLLVACISSASAAATITDSKSNTWTKLTAGVSPHTEQTCLFYVASPTVGSGHTFSTTVGFPAIEATAWSGSAASPLDQQNNNTALGTTVQPGSVTPGSNNELIVTGFEPPNGGSGAISIDSGFTITDAFQFASGTSWGGGLAYLIQSTAAAVNPTWSWTSGNNQPVAVIATFKAAAGGGGFTAKFRRTLSQLGTRVGSRQIHKAA